MPKTLKEKYQAALVAKGFELVQGRGNAKPGWLYRGKNQHTHLAFHGRMIFLGTRGSIRLGYTKSKSVVVSKVLVDWLMSDRESL